MAHSATALGLSPFTVASPYIGKCTSSTSKRKGSSENYFIMLNLKVKNKFTCCAGGIARTCVQLRDDGDESGDLFISRRACLSTAAVLLSSLYGAGTALAVTPNQVAGRVPGLSEPDANGLRQYKRPEGKSGGHGVGWSEMIPYSFTVPDEWAEVPVSIADLGGTEIDLRFQNKSEGNISVVVAPCQRFSDRVGNNARIEDIGTPERVIFAFGPEITGQNVEGLVKDMRVKEVAGRTYYQYELNTPHQLVTATAAGNRLYIFSVAANGRQWKKHEEGLRQISESFLVG